MQMITNATPVAAPVAAKPAPTAPVAPTAHAAPTAPPKQWSSPPAMTIDASKSYTATLATDQGTIGVELLAKQAPHTVNNFKFLADQGFYRDVAIHRVVKDFMFQSGDPTGTGTGGPGYEFADELPPAGTVYTKGTVAMANAGPNTNGSQFFIMTHDAPLPPAYSIFGKVTSGMDVVDRLNATPVGPSASGEVSAPLTPINFRDITVKERAA